MLKSQNRLKKETDFSAVFRSGKRTVCGELAVMVLDNSLAVSRIGVVVSGKISRAVGRNRIRRIILSEAALLLRTGQIATGKDIVVRLLKTPADLTNSEPLRQQLRTCFATLS